MNIIVSSNLSPAKVGLNSIMAIDLVHMVAESFSLHRKDDHPVHSLLRSTIGDYKYMWYCIDMSADIYRITFSDEDSPRLLTFQGHPAAIAPTDAAPLKVFMQEIDLVKPPSAIPDRTRACSVEHLDAYKKALYPGE